MTKEEFLGELRSSLSGNVSAQVINDNLGYYENFINTEIRKGRSEEDVFEELGNPRLLAKTIIDTADSSDRRTVGSGEESDEGTTERTSTVLPWWAILFIIFGIMILIFVVVNVAAVLLPVLIALVIAGLVIRFFKGRS